MAAAMSLYKEGVREVYKAPSHFGVLAMSWAIGTLCIGKTLDMALEGYYQLREGHGLSPLKKWAVEAGNRLGMIFITVAGGYAILRYNGLVKSMRLVSNSMGVLEMEVSVRRLIPVLPPKIYRVPSFSVRMPARWKLIYDHRAEEAAPKTASRLFYYPFIKFKNFLTKDQILAATMGEEQINCLVDAKGTFTPSMAAVEAITSEMEPWNR